MAWVFGTLTFTLALLFVWGLVSPRSQWRVLRGWSVSDTHRNEPGGATYGMLRLGSAVGVIGLATVAIVAVTSAVANLPDPPRAKPAVEQMWGDPAPQLVNRIPRNLPSPPVGLVEVPVLGYQTFDDGIPDYLLEMREFSLLGDAAPAGILGAEPEEGTSAIGSSNLLLHVRGPVLCIPRAVVVIETDTTVQVAVYFGLPDPLDEAAVVDHVAGCPADSHLTSSMLLPVQLSGPVLDRSVQALDGTELDYVELQE